MKKTLSILTVFVLGATVFLAVKNKEAYENQIQARTAEEIALDGAKKAYQKTSEEKEVALADLAAQQDKNKSLGQDLEKQEALVSDLRSQLESQKEVAESKKDEVEKNEEMLAELGEVPDLIAKMKRMREEKTSLDAQIVSARSAQSALEKNKDQLGAEITRKQEVVRNYTVKKSRANLKTRIGRVMRQWGFVTISGGDAVGIVKDSTLDVMRNGEAVAQLLVTAVESNTAGANIVPVKGRLPEVYPGDLVVASAGGGTAPPVSPVSSPAEKVEVAKSSIKEALESDQEGSDEEEVGEKITEEAGEETTAEDVAEEAETAEEELDLKEDGVDELE